MHGLLGTGNVLCIVVRKIIRIQVRTDDVDRLTMAGNYFFSLGGESGSGTTNPAESYHQQVADQFQSEISSSSSWLLHRNHHEDHMISSYRSGSFELWRRQARHHHHQQQQREDLFISDNRPQVSVDVSNDGDPRSAFMMFGGGGIRGGISCQDCGNQAKKSCTHMRCRTCCKNRGFQCQTHVKSTWVPAAKRRERQQQLAAHHQEQQQQLQQPTSRQNHTTQRQNNIDQTVTLSHLPLPPSTTNNSLEVGNYPWTLDSESEFRMVRLRSNNDKDEEEYGYQTAVSIGGHVYKGILYDQGPDQSSHYDYVTGQTNSSAAATEFLDPPSRSTTLYQRPPIR